MQGTFAVQGSLREFGMQFVARFHFATAECENVVTKDIGIEIAESIGREKAGGIAGCRGAPVYNQGLAFTLNDHLARIVVFVVILPPRFAPDDTGSLGPIPGSPAGDAAALFLVSNAERINTGW